jgi:peptidyl-dipeptidase Dcp
MTRANGQRFRDMILSKGHTEDYAPMFRAFNGADPQVEPLLKDLGLNADGTRIAAEPTGTPASDGTATPAVTPAK